MAVAAEAAAVVTDIGPVTDTAAGAAGRRRMARAILAGDARGGGPRSVVTWDQQNGDGHER
jgi:hypothetical protein